MTEDRSAGETQTHSVASDNKIGRTKLVILISIAFVPIFVAYIVFFNFPELLPSMTTNNGTLIQPPIQLSELKLEPEHKWLLLIPVGKSCDANCEETLHMTRQIHIGLGKYTPRIQRVILTQTKIDSAFEALLAREHNEVKLISIDGTSTLAELKRLASGQFEQMVFVMDPNGNIMMYFTPDQVGKPMLKDLKHLLKISSIG